MRKNAYAVALGRKGGKKGGPARAARMTAAQRSESARHAVLARWQRGDRAVSAGTMHLDARGFLANPTFDDLVRQQGGGPQRDPRQLAGVFPDEFDVDEMVAGIYRERV